MTNPHISLNPRLSHRLLLPLVSAMTFLSFFTGATTQFEGEVGGSVTFRCLPAGHRELNLIYFQRVIPGSKQQEFVNGYYATRNTSHMAWKNTRVDHKKATMEMDSLNISHNGDYQCYYRYSDSGAAEPPKTLRLRVTANYSKPTLTVDHCGDGTCQVTCSSHGGYPATEVMWNVESQKRKVLNNSEMTNPDTMTVNSSSTASLNCSSGQISVSCSLDDVTSNTIPVCTPEEAPPHGPYVIPAVVVVVVVLIVSGLLLFWRYKKGQRGAGEARRGEEMTWREEEVIVLNENKEGKDASQALDG